MKKTFALTATVVFSQAMFLFAGETEISSKNVIQPAPLPPASYFRANEFDLGPLGLTTQHSIKIVEPLETTHGVEA